MVSHLDRSVGKIVNAVESSGMYDNSVIIFTSDVSSLLLIWINSHLNMTKFRTEPMLCMAAVTIHSEVANSHYGREVLGYPQLSVEVLLNRKEPFTMGWYLYC